jgi:hypothetical protein
VVPQVGAACQRLFEARPVVVEPGAAATGLPIGQTVHAIETGLARVGVGPDIAEVGVERSVRRSHHPVRRGEVGRVAHQRQVGDRIGRLDPAVGGARVVAVAPFDPIAVRPFEKRVLLDLPLDEVLEFHVGELQQLDRLLQLRRHHQRLCLAQIQALRDCHRGLREGP